jgi:hypothetical protein
MVESNETPGKWQLADEEGFIRLSSSHTASATVNSILW